MKTQKSQKSKYTSSFVPIQAITNGMIILNSGIWWSDTTNTGKMPDYINQSVRDVDFTNYKLSSTAKRMIGDSRYYLAGHNSTSITTTTCIHTKEQKQEIIVEDMMRIDHIIGKGK